MSFKEFLKEKVISGLLKKVTVNIDNMELATTYHGDTRMFRTDVRGSTVSEQEIRNDVYKALDKIINDYANGEIPNNQEILITNTSTNLNIVGRLTMRKGLDSFVVITVMRKRGFTPKPGTEVYTI
jgi:hypothetical protein